MRKLIPVVAALAGLVVPAAAAAQDTPPPAAPAPEPPAPSPAPPPPASAAPSSPPPASSPPAAPSVLQALAALGSDSPPGPPEGNAVQGLVFPEESPPPGDPANPNAVRFALHGYFRAPLRIASAPALHADARRRELHRHRAPSLGEATTNLHTPWLIDDDPQRSGFVYTRNPGGRLHRALSHGRQHLG